MSLELPYIAVIPYNVQVDNTISDAAKLYYGQIVSLAKKHGYIFATDDSLAEMKGVSKRSIERWHNELEKAGHLTKTIEYTKTYDTKHKKVIMVSSRKIYINDGFQNKSTLPPKMAEWSTPKHTAKNGGLYIGVNKAKKRKQQRAASPKPPASVVVFSKKIEDKLEKLKVTPAERRRWQYSEAEVDTALTVMESQETDNPLRTFRAALKRGWKVNTPKPKKGQIDPEQWVNKQNQTLKEKHKIVIADNKLQFTGIEIEGIKTYFKRKEINLNKTPLDEKLCEFINCELTQIRQTY